MKLSPRRVIIGMTALLVAGLLASCVYFFGRTSSQRQAMQRLNEIGVAAVARCDTMDCVPAYSFDSYGPRMIEDFTGPAYFGNVTDVYFRMSDDQQVAESIPYLEGLEKLNRVMFHRVPSDSVVAKLRQALPDVQLVDEQAEPIP